MPTSEDDSASPGRCQRGCAAKRGDPPRGLAGFWLDFAAAARSLHHALHPRTKGASRPRSSPCTQTTKPANRRSNSIIQFPKTAGAPNHHRRLSPAAAGRCHVRPSAVPFLRRGRPAFGKLPRPGPGDQFASLGDQHGFIQFGGFSALRGTARDGGEHPGVAPANQRNAVHAECLRCSHRSAQIFPRHGLCATAL